MNPTVHSERGSAVGRPQAVLPTIHVIDDEASVRTAVARLLGSTGSYRVLTHDCAEDFLAAYDPEDAGCLVLDVGLPRLDGMGLQDALRGSPHPVAIVFLSGCADVPMCADALRRGAVDFLTKPVDETLLFAAVERALERDASTRAQQAQKASATQRIASLTPREREVITHVMAGRLNKQIAADIGTAEKTVKVHRARGMEKMHVRSVAELVRLVERAHVPLV
jgi:FixJ family two-component response regulator